MQIIRYLKIMMVLAVFISMGACKKYLDVVPDGVATIENAFTLRATAERYLFTCYSYMPDDGSFNSNPGFTSGDEVWYMFPSKDVSTSFWNIARGGQNVNAPLGNYWEGTSGGTALFIALRDCNIFLDNIHKVPDMDNFEKEKWKTEVIFLKAYYHFLLVRSYGPIPLVKKNLPIESDREAVQVYRDPLDSCFNYIVELLDQVIASDRVPDRIDGTEAADLGRVTKAMAYAFKAKVLVTAASPLFNGNPDYTGVKDNKGRSIFPAYSGEKWVQAAAACKTAIEFCHGLGFELYKYNNVLEQLAGPLKVQADLRGAVSDKETTNREVIWHNTNSRAGDMQRWSMCNIKTVTSGSGPKGIIAPPIKMAEMFYTKNGLPIDQDNTWDYANKNALKKATDIDSFYIGTNEECTQLHYNREPRFYASLAFDRGIWYGNWDANYAQDDIAYIKARKGEAASRQGISNYSITGYWVKKLVAIATTTNKDGALTTVQYPWPELRLADLYLLYAEALNELNGPSPETFLWIDKVRARAGIPTVEVAWSTYAKENARHTTKDGLRSIIHQERSNELAFEGHRVWDQRRWKTAHLEFVGPVKGWDIEQKDAASYYKEVILFNQSFSMREYLWPISVKELLRNKNLVQNAGW